MKSFCTYVVTFFMVLIFLQSCAAMPSLFQAVDDIVTDDAILVEVDKDAIKKDTDIFINVEVRNKDEAKGTAGVAAAPAASK